MNSRYFASLLYVVIASACAPDDRPLDDPDDALEAVVQQTVPNTAVTRLLMLRSDTPTATRLYPIILTAPRAADRPAWSSAFRLLCNDCKRAYEAFGYAVEDALFSVQYQTEAALRADNQVDDALPLIDLPFEATDATPAVLAAFRVIDASEPSDPRYLVRLRAAPELLYATSCENFLRVAQGSLATTPITKPLLTHWHVPAQLPAIGCSTIGGKPLPVPAPAPAVTPPLTFSSIESIWLSNQPGPSLSGEAYPYVIAKEPNGTLRGYPIACGSEARSALSSLGASYSDLRTEPASADELLRTNFGKQPTIRCKGTTGGKIVEITASNDSSKKKKFRFGDDRDLIEFACRDSEAYWSREATERLTGIPYQALAYLSDFEDGGGNTRIFTLGCRSENLCAQVTPGATPACPVKPPPVTPTPTPTPPTPKPTPTPTPARPPVPPTSSPPRRDPGDNCVWIEFCDYPNNAAGAVCRTFAGCAINASLAECRSDMQRVCGNPRGPNYFCDQSSTNCRQL